MTAIVYESNTGSAKRYAEMLGEKTGFPVYPLPDCDKIEKDSEIIFFGWVMAGTVQGLKAVRENFSAVKAVCAVGILKSEKAEADLIKSNEIEEPFFYLQGSFDMKKLHGMYKMLMGVAVRAMKMKIKDVDDPNAKKAVEMIDGGVDLVSEESLEAIVEFLNN